MEFETYADAIVKQPSKTPSEKAITPAAPPPVSEDLADSIARRMAAGEIRIPRGVYRFKTHEEADQWMDEMIARSRKD